MDSQPQFQNVVVASKTDQASYNIAQSLIRDFGFSEARSPKLPHFDTYKRGASTLLVIADKDCIHVDPEDLPIQTSQMIFVSKHRSNQDRPALTVHSTGNLAGEAMFGGRPMEVSLVEPRVLKLALSSLARRVVEAGVNIEVTMEATHHGPTSFAAPLCFVEIGSTPKEWTDPNLGRIAAAATIDALEVQNSSIRTVGFGGTHYPARHSRINLEGEYAVGHVVPKHAFENGVSEEVLKATFARTTDSCEIALVDWKGLKGGHRQWLVGLLEKWQKEIVRA